MRIRVRGFEPVSEAKRKDTDNVYMPIRSTKSSAAYDLLTPRDVEIKPGEKQLIWTNTKAYMQPNEVFIINVRSSGGTKLDLMLANTIGFIDADYYNNPDNEGNIGVCLRNLGDKTVTFKAGEKIAQGIFISYLTADNCNSDEERKGGFGSTGK
jgi:dUTP pyrophosphatase